MFAFRSLLTNQLTKVVCLRCNHMLYDINVFKPGFDILQPKSYLAFHKPISVYYRGFIQSYHLMFMLVLFNLFAFFPILLSYHLRYCIYCFQTLSLIFFVKTL